MSRERPILMSGPLVREILAGRKTMTRRPVKNLRARLRHEVSSDLPELVRPVTKLQPAAYPVELNPHGAVSARTPDGGLLGLKPQEFDFLCPYAEGHTYLRKFPDGRALWHLQVTPSRLWVRETVCFLDPDHYNERDLPRDHLSDRYGTPRRNGCAYRAEVTAEGEEIRKEYGYRWTPGIHMPRWACRLTLDVTSVRLERLQEITTVDAKAEGLSCQGDFFAKWDEIHGRDAWKTDPWVWAITFRRLAEVDGNLVRPGEAILSVE